MTGSKPSGHALVIGAGVAGLLSARVLAERFERVAVVDRDPLDEHGVPRKGVPQGRHPHALLARGGELLEGMFPGLTGELVAAGAELVDMAATPRWWQPGGYRLPFDSGRSELMLTRPLLEAHVRRRVCALANVTSLGERTTRPPGSPSTATGALRASRSASACTTRHACTRAGRATSPARHWRSPSPPRRTSAASA